MPKIDREIRYPERLSFRLSTEARRTLERRAQRMGVSAGFVMRSLLKLWLTHEMNTKLVDEDADA